MCILEKLHITFKTRKEFHPTSYKTNTNQNAYKIIFIRLVNNRTIKPNNLLKCIEQRF